VIGTADCVYSDAGQCADTVVISITVVHLILLVNFQWTVTEAFRASDYDYSHCSWNYLYRLDDGPFQESSSFEYVSAGYHSQLQWRVLAESVSITRSDILVIGT
jgi:hypothetical protein